MLIRRPPERRVPRSTFDWLFEDPWADGGEWAAGSMPSVDMRETEDAYVIEAEMPGVRPEDIDVTLDGRMLIIRGEYGTRREEREQGEQKQGRYILQERRSGTYTRAITLPAPVDADRIESSFENGELRLTLPKDEASRTRRIKIGGGGAANARQVGSGSGTTPAEQRDGEGGRQS